MTCPDGTGFDVSLEACDYVANVKACAKGELIFYNLQKSDSNYLLQWRKTSEVH
jgi:hypothetical protein